MVLRAWPCKMKNFDEAVVLIGFGVNVAILSIVFFVLAITYLVP